MPIKEQLGQKVYQLRIDLKDIRPPIWRRVEVAERMRLSNLHDVIQVLFGWTDSHLHQFLIDGTYYGVPEYFDDITVMNENTVHLGRVIRRRKQRFEYIYDFGDNWEHTIVVEQIRPAQEGRHEPTCLAGKRHTPPEDCGGPWGYEEFLTAIRDPRHEEHAAMLEWAGEQFDPEAFDREAVNRALTSSAAFQRRR